MGEVIYAEVFLFSCQRTWWCSFEVKPHPGSLCPSEGLRTCVIWNVHALASHWGVLCQQKEQSSELSDLWTGRLAGVLLSWSMVYDDVNHVLHFRVYRPKGEETLNIFCLHVKRHSTAENNYNDGRLKHLFVVLQTEREDSAFSKSAPTLVGMVLNWSSFSPDLILALVLIRSSLGPILIQLRSWSYSSFGTDQIQLWSWTDPALVLILFRLWYWSDPTLFLIWSSFDPDLILGLVLIWSSFGLDQIPAFVLI